MDLADAQLANTALIGRALRQVRLPGNVLVLGIRRRGAIVIPHGDTSLREGDVLMLVGQPDDLRAACGLIEGRALHPLAPTGASRAWRGWSARAPRPPRPVSQPVRAPELVPERRQDGET